MSSSTLLGEWAEQAFSPIVTKGGFLSSPSVTTGLVLERKQWLFDAGATLAYIYRGGPPFWTDLFSKPGTGIETLRGLGEEATQLLEDQDSAPESLFELVYRKDAREGYSSLLNFARMASTKVLLKGNTGLPAHLSMLELSGLIGLGFGYRHPDLFARLWHKTYGSFEAHQWSEVAKEGVVLSEHPKPISLEERQQAVRKSVSKWVIHSQPHLRGLATERSVEDVGSLFPTSIGVGTFTDALGIWLWENLRRETANTR